MKILSALLLLLFVTNRLLAQPISKQEADSLSLSLQKTHSDAGHMNALTALAEYQVLKPGEFKADFDSAENYLSQATVINAKVKSGTADGYILFVRSLLAKEKGQKEQGKVMVEKAMMMLKNGSNKSYYGKACFALAGYYDYSNSTQMVEMIRLVGLAVDAFKQSNDLEHYAFSSEFLADLYLNQRNNIKSLEYLDSALIAYNAINSKKLEGVYVLYGTNHLVLRNFRLALKYQLLALKTAENLHDSSMQLCQIHNSIANTLVWLKEYEPAIVHYRQGLDIALKYSDTSSVLLLTNNLIIQKITLHRIAEAVKDLNSVPQQYFAPTNNAYYAYVLIANFNLNINLGNLDRAKYYGNELLKFSKSHELPGRFMYNFYQLMFNFHTATGEYALLNTDIGNMEKTSPPTPVLQRELYQHRFKRDTTIQNYKSAVFNLIEVKKRDDSIFNQTSDRERKQIEVEYETSKKQDSIQLKNKDILLLTQQNKYQEAIHKQDIMTKRITIGGLILLCIILLLLYRQYHNKQKSSTLISEKNNQLQHLLSEKEWLVKEIHHRVKNNFQTVMGLLGTQSAYLESEEAIRAINESQNRIQAMSLIHQRLYQSNNLSAIKMNDYIHELIHSLSDSFNSSNHIKFHLDLEPIELELAHCIPLGLILNEAITNSFKYAFPGNKEGLITISLNNTLDNHILLRINDNGKGLPIEFNMNHSNSMGMNLMKGLSSEIGARFSIFNHNGTQIDVSFKYSPRIQEDVKQLKSEPAYT